MKELNGYRDTLARRVAAALDHPARKTPEGLALAAEVRAHIKAMKKPDERMKFVAQAVDAEDVETVAAVLHAQPLLSGLAPKTHATLRARSSPRWMMPSLPRPMRRSRRHRVRFRPGEALWRHHLPAECPGREGGQEHQGAGRGGPVRQPDPISIMLADGYVARHGTGPKLETAAELGARLVREARAVALEFDDIMLHHSLSF